MHIPSSMLNGAVCPLTLAVSAAGVGCAAWLAQKAKKKPSRMKFAAVTALIFALQMLNYPVQNGTSGHLVGAVLGVALLGIPFTVLSMTVVLAVQAFVFGDGGVAALGANVLNMALIGAGLAGGIRHVLLERGANEKIVTGLTAFLAVIAGAFACSTEVAASGAVAWNKVMPAMLSVHALIGIGEALLTVAVVYVLNLYGYYKKEKENSLAVSAAVLALAAVVLSPLASGFPDGLEWVAHKLSFVAFSGFEPAVWFPDYQALFISQGALSTIVAGAVGMTVVFGVTLALGKMLKAPPKATA